MLVDLFITVTTRLSLNISGCFISWWFKTLMCYIRETKHIFISFFVSYLQILDCKILIICLSCTCEDWSFKKKKKRCVFMCMEISPGKAWHSDWFWSHWQFRFSEQLLQLASLLHTCSFLTGHSVKFFTFYPKRGDRKDERAVNTSITFQTKRGV